MKFWTHKGWEPPAKAHSNPKRQATKARSMRTEKKRANRLIDKHLRAGY